MKWIKRLAWRIVLSDLEKDYDDHVLYEHVGLRLDERDRKRGMR